ncbi:3-methyladenine DNA glycosylase [Knoellia sinensis KCTC 19936]|uniref:Putative 3-methyladenine DNA glycosylase n=1 Tax=Knoellia sinensis KCTC 19936 TaxID=1385520 RepID=A0A0A0JAY0_9MICO|nr:3-methyladenine DNA glycosylase [Knoellia sinensis KCTC 19936]
MTTLPREFFARPVLDVSRDLLGAHLTHGGVTIRVTETEAYAGHGVDPGSHAFRGETPRTAPMFGPPGVTYVYFTYGMHWMLCLVTGELGTAEAVLVRAGEVVDGHDVAAARRPGIRERDWCRGPARLATTLALDGSHTGRDFCHPPLGPVPSIDLTVATGEPRPDHTIRSGPRVGVSGPGGDGTAYPWRFWTDGEPTVSAYRPGVIRRRSR